MQSFGMIIKQKKFTAIFSAILAVLCIAVSFYLFYTARKNPSDITFSDTRTGIAMGTEVTQKLYAKSSDHCKEIMDQIDQTISTLDSELSWQKSTSQTALVNQSAGKNSVSAPAVKEMLGSILPLCALTDGRFDPTIGPLSQLWDVENRDRVPSVAEIEQARSRTGYPKIRLSGEKIKLAESGMALDFGAVGKGAACDRALNVLRKNNATGAVVAIGGSIAVYGKRADQKPWRIAVRDPDDAEKSIGEILVKTGKDVCISTSGNYEKYFEQDGVRYHHILDALTGSPAQSGLASVTIVHKSGLLSDALSTACFIVGLEKSQELLDKYGAQAIFIDDRNEIYITKGLKDVFEPTLLERSKLHVFGENQN